MSKADTKGLRRRLATTLVGVALVSVVLLATVIFIFARELIDGSVESQMTSIRDTRAQALEIGAERIQSRVSTLAADASVVDALIDLSAEFGALDEDITSDQVDELTALYDTEVLPPFVEAGADIDASSLLPGSSAGRYLQHHYITENPDGFDQRDQLDDAGDGSGYSVAHAEHHPLLRALMENASMYDLLLVDGDSGDVVYSTKKRIDLGTNRLDGANADSGLGRVIDKLSNVAVGESVISDTFFYAPTHGQPVFFLAAAVRSGSDVLGAVVTEIPVQGLTSIMTADQDWSLLGLGDTGESYIVGSDGTLRSDTRAWLEDPDDYLRRFFDETGDQQRADLIETIGSPVLVQKVDNEAVISGLDGDEFIGSVKNYLGTKTLTASGPANVEGVNWAVVVEIDKSETGSALNSMLRSMLVVLAVLLPTIAIVGVLLSRILTKPADSLVLLAAEIAHGDLGATVEDLGRNELGDLGRQLEGVVRELESREQAIIDEEQHINDMLRALLPARLVDRVRRGEQAISDILDTATVVSITVDDTSEAMTADQDLALEITERLNEEVEALMEQFGVERIQRSSGSQLYVTGLDHDDARVADAASFALAAKKKVAEISEEFGQALEIRAGMSAGDVATGVLGTSQPSFGAWGDPPGKAVTLGSLSRPGQLLADGSVVEALGPEWDVGPLEQLPGLDDDLDARVVNGPVNGPAQ